jgi:cell division protein FtsZ
MIQFDLPKQKSSIIKVLGVGGGGSNAVNFMFKQDIEGVDFIICNTDSKAIEQSDVPNKIQLGPHLTQGLGAGADPSVGKLATEESLEEIRKILEVNTRMAFITVGMGGGTGTGGAPIIAKICKDLGILTVGIVTTPFGFEGPRRQKQAEEGINQLKPLVDTLLVISNDKLRVQYGNLKMKEAFTKADNVLATAAKCITDVINSRGHIIVDFADVCTVMKNGGVAILGKSEVEGENRAQRAIEEALNSPLLNDNDIKGAKWILLNINSAEGDHECTMDELETINAYLRERTGENSDVIMGMGYDETLGQKIGITLIATGFEGKDPFKKDEPKKAEAPIEEKIVMTLVTEEAAKLPEVAPVAESVIEEQIIEEPMNEVHDDNENDNHFVLDTTLASENTIVLFESEEIIEEPIALQQVEMEMEAPEEIAEVSISAMESIELENYMPSLMEEEIHEGTNEEAHEEDVMLDEILNEEVEEEMIEEEEMFALDMEAPAPLDYSTEFILSKPTNIYADASEDHLEEAAVNEVSEDLTQQAPVVFEFSLEEEAPLVVAEKELEEAVPEEAPTPEVIMESPKAPVVEFETSFRYQEEPAMQLVMREDATSNMEVNSARQNNYDMPVDNAEEQRKKVAERIQKLRNLSFNINNGSDPNNEFESVPAYVRRNMDLFGNTLASVENYYSKYTVEKDENNQTQISTINTFLDGKKPD